MFLLFEQPKEAGEAGARKEVPPERNSFDLRLWARDFGLGNPVGFTYFVASKQMEATQD